MSRPRYWEIDCLRGLAVALMLVSNFLFDLFFFTGRTQFESQTADWCARLIAGLFILLAGVSLTLSRARGANFLAFLCRGLSLIGLGLLISLATWMVAGDQMVVFGVLHLIGLGTILAWPLLDRPWTSLGAAIAILLLTSPIRRTLLVHPWFLWLGLRTPDFASVDYTPLIPWLGPLLLGLFLGQRLYPGGKRRWPLDDSQKNRWPVRLLSLGGRHSLLIYLAHQPVFLAAILAYRRWVWV